MSIPAGKSGLTRRYELWEKRNRQSQEIIHQPTEKSEVNRGRVSTYQIKKHPPVPPLPIATKPRVPNRDLPPHLPPRIAPPPLPSRPKRSTIDTPSLPAFHCLFCRDFSAVDKHASKFPRQQVKSLDELANDLTAPFPSITDKARAIFVWLHHNIVYDTESFFSGNLKASTGSSTLSSGRAVCEGYAGLFYDLASRSGVEAKVVSGFGKGYGYSYSPGGTLPKFESNHAWNAVRLDSGEWHLVDACWGAGQVDASKTFKKNFNPVYFCCSNDEFGRNHFPENMEMQLLHTPRTWMDFIMISERPTIFSTTLFQINPRSLLPQTKMITLGWHRFVVEKSCSMADGVDSLLMLVGPSNNRTIMKKNDNDIWECSVDIQERGSWCCCIALDGHKSVVKLPEMVTDRDIYRYGWEGLCCWESV
jgi:hypothetical protein